MIKIGSRRSLTPILHTVIHSHPVRQSSRHIIFHINIRSHIQGSNDPVEIIETSCRRPVGDRFAKIHTIRPCFYIIPIPSEVPFTDPCRLIPLIPQHRSDRSAVRSDQSLIVSHQYTGFEIGTPVIPSGQHTITRRCADG